MEIKPIPKALLCFVHREGDRFSQYYSWTILSEHAGLSMSALYQFDEAKKAKRALLRVVSKLNFPKEKIVIESKTRGRLVYHADRLYEET